MNSNTVYPKYPKMESFRRANHSQMEEFAEHWVLQEKIHGTNSQFLITGQGDDHPLVELGKRNGLVTDDENQNFYQIKATYQKYWSKLLAAFDTACYTLGLDSRHTTGSFYAELYGPRVQKQMQYSESNDIAIFDIVIDGEPLTYCQMEEVCRTHSLPMAPEVKRGTLAEVLDFDPETIHSLVPSKLQGVTNETAPCEGVIIRPLNSPSWEHRYKWKQRSFCERPPKSPTNALALDVSQYCNQMRLESYLSKVGPEHLLDAKNIGQNIRALCDDCWLDIDQDLPELKHDSKSKKQIHKVLTQMSHRLLFNFRQEYVPPTLTLEERLQKAEDTHLILRSQVGLYQTILANSQNRLRLLEC